MTREKNTEQKHVESERVTKPASKWDAFLIDDEGDNRAPPRFGQKLVLKDDDVGDWDKAIMEIGTDCQIVDDDVHPDFM